jgi:IPT/TIG domain
MIVLLACLIIGLACLAALPYSPTSALRQQSGIVPPNNLVTALSHGLLDNFPWGGYDAKHDSCSIRLLDSLARSRRLQFRLYDLTSSSPNISISPSSAVVGSPDLTMIVTGTNFIHSTHDVSFVVFIVNGTTDYLTTTFVSSTQLTAVIPAALMVSPVSGSIQVQTGDPLGSGPFAESNSIAFSVNSP